MASGPDDLLFGRIALHYKLVTREQLVEASRLQAAAADHRSLGEILVDRGYLAPGQLEQLLTVQRDYVARHQASPASRAPAPAALSLEEPHALDRLLEHALRSGASDLHVHSGAPLKLRTHGRLTELDSATLDARTAERLIFEILTPEQAAALRERGQVDFAYTLPDVGRFRSNVYRQQRGLDAVFRAIPPEPPTLEELGLPATLARFTNYHQGMVLLTGPAGCGKSSTLAALLNILNEERRDHIITIEDPDRVPPPLQALRRQPAPGRARTPAPSRAPCAPPCARTRTSS